ncbi:hypothetical protein M8C21_028000, partial [Ambrosia artemisiifolia]
MASKPLRQSGITTSIDTIGQDLLHDIVSRLPATSFASAACVSRSWNLLCDRILSRPKLASACSDNSPLEDQYRVGMMDVVEQMGYAMSHKTVIVGDCSSRFRYSNCPDAWSIGAALVFAVESNKPPGYFKIYTLAS